MGSKINVRAYGAVGNGVANDTSAILGAITAAGSTGSVFFPAGTYLTDQINLANKTGFSLFGDGMGVSVLKQRQADTGQLLNIASSCTGVSIFGLTFDGSGTHEIEGLHAIAIAGTQIRVLYNEIKNANKFSIYFGDGTSDHNQVNFNWVHGGFSDGINMTGSSYSEAIGNIVESEDDCLVFYGVTCHNNISSGNLLTARIDVAGGPADRGRGLAILNGAYNITSTGDRIGRAKQYGVIIGTDGGSRPHDIKISNVVVRNAAYVSGSAVSISSADRVTLDHPEIVNPLHGDCITMDDSTDLVVSGGVLSANLSASRGVHAVETGSGSPSNYLFDGVKFIGTHASSCTAVYCNAATATINGITVSNWTVNQVCTDDWCLIAHFTPTTAKVVNNVCTPTRTVYTGPTVANNN